MSADFLITSGRDLSIANGTLATAGSAAEVTQRVVTRLLRQLGEWFLNTTVGLPWYAYAGQGPILGGNGATVQAAEMMIRQTIQQTSGVASILSFSAGWNSNKRTLTVAAKIVTAFGDVAFVTATQGA